MSQDEPVGHAGREAHGGGSGEGERVPGGSEPGGGASAQDERRPAPVRTERRVYVGGGVWVPADGAGDGGAVPRVAHGASVASPVSRGASAWNAAFRIALSLPLVWGGSVAAGASVYLVGVAVAADRPDLSPPWLVLLAALSLAAAAALCFGCGLLLDCRPHDRPAIAAVVVLGIGTAGAAAAAVLVSASLPVVGAAVLLGYATVATVAGWLAGRGGREPAGRPLPAGAGVGVPAVVASSPPGATSLDERTRQWSWDRSRTARDHTTAVWVLRVFGALVAAACAVLAGFVGFSLAVASFLSGQAALGWHDTLLSDALEASGGRSVVKVIALLFVNLGVAALFGAFAWVAARCLAAWTGRLHRVWVIVLAGLVVAGVVAWLLDGSLPR